MPARQGTAHPVTPERRHGTQARHGTAHVFHTLAHRHAVARQGIFFASWQAGAARHARRDTAKHSCRSLEHGHGTESWRQ
eukprot:147652-Pyramimonas_sp.AAC.1